MGLRRTAPDREPAAATLRETEITQLAGPRAGDEDTNALPHSVQQHSGCKKQLYSEGGLNLDPSGRAAESLFPDSNFSLQGPLSLTSSLFFLTVYRHLGS